MKTSWLLLSTVVVLLKITTQSNSPNSKCNLTEQFDCGTECIPRTWECDNMKDCKNAADEIDCEPSECPDGQMQCDSGGCIPGAYKCDGHNDCPDRSDEAYCGHISYRLSENSSFNFCDPNHYKNDGGYDKNGCLPGFGFCGTRRMCIPNRSWYHETDLDENHCTPGGPGGKKEWFSKTPENPCKNMFACKTYSSWSDQKCINETEVCNGKQECPLGDDESKKCSECSSTHCEHQCRNTPTGAKCDCNKGYQLDSDEVSCVDLDECTLPERACHHFCENTFGSFRCSCAKGYQLKADGKTCELSDIPEGFLLLSKFDEIQRRPLEDVTETKFTTVHKNPEGRHIKAFDYSRRDNKFFMSIGGVENEKLVVEQNGTLRVLCENAAMKKYKHLAVDWIGNNLFFQEEEVYQNEGKISSRNFISVCTMDGRFYRRLIEIEDDRNVQGFAINPMRGFLFWHDSFNAVDAKKRYPYRIMMANMDGSQVQLLIRSKSRLCRMFAIDRVNNYVYYATNDNRIRRVNIDTRKTDVVGSNLWFGSEAMAYHNGFIYWTNLHGELEVQEVARSSARVHRILESGSGPFHFPHLIVNDSFHQLEPSAGNPCAELDCPWICVIVPDFTAKCLCPDGHTPSVLGTTCVSSLPEVGDHDNLTYIGLELMSEYCKAGVGCLNGGSCREVSNKTRIVCDCVEPYDGLYCERRKPMVSDEAVLIIVILLLLIAIGFGIYYLFFIRRIGKTEAAEIVLSVVCLSILDECLENNGTTD